MDHLYIPLVLVMCLPALVALIVVSINYARSANENKIYHRIESQGIFKEYRKGQRN
jgi:hypothetical protein